MVAIGNGTASREAEQLVGAVLESLPQEQQSRGVRCKYAVVSEAGASVYSACEAAAAELPTLDVTLRGAVSIARRLQDPLAELVKVPPEALGVGAPSSKAHQTKHAAEAATADSRQRGPLTYPTGSNTAASRPWPAHKRACD